MIHKNGVTLITLGVTIVVLAIITGAVIINTTGIIDKSTTAKFGEEIKLIEDKIEEHYITNGTFPIVSGTEYTVEQIVALNTAGHGSKLRNEITKNKDDGSIFYLIDYSKIKLTVSERGVQATQDDIYVVSRDTNTVYYVKGLEIGDEVYFSLAYISDKNKITESN